MGNKTPSEMRLERSHNWSSVPITFPGTIPAHGAATLIHVRDKSSKAAAVYSGPNAAGLACSWLLAWNAPAPTPGAQNKVYVICGAKERIDELSFDEIENMLAKSKTDAEFADLVTKTYADAKINPLVSESATIVSNFGLLP